MVKKILVVGGAGYIGSHMVWLLGQQGVEVVVLDDLSSGHADAVLAGTLVVGDMANRLLLDQLFTQHRFDAVMHFASFIQVGESMLDPAKYYRNNVTNTLTLLDAMLAHKVDKFIFSSTAAVFGEPQYTPIDERHVQNPINPYGRSKWMVEQVLQDLGRAHGLRSVCLRYFNAAGAHPQGLLGERHLIETHLIPLILQTASGRRSDIQVFGDDYDTPDGTCVRDYVHVMDLGDAHVRALDYLVAGHPSRALNLGSGVGFTNREVLDTVRRVSGRAVEVIEGPRREGDPPQLVASRRLAQQLLGWEPRLSDVETIVRHAWAWEQKLAGR
jgi:UDP-glucose 4-epimerase